jgi:hypothetical protein
MHVEHVPIKLGYLLYAHNGVSSIKTQDKTEARTILEQAVYKSGNALAKALQRKPNTVVRARGRKCGVVKRRVWSSHYRER